MIPRRKKSAEEFRAVHDAAAQTVHFARKKTARVLRIGGGVFLAATEEWLKPGTEAGA